MKRRTLALCGVSALVAAVIACSSANPAAPVAPSTTGANAAAPVAPSAPGANAAADGSTLKADAPGTLSPINDQKLTSPVVNLTARAATLQFPSATPVTLQYRFQVFNAAGATVENALVSATTYQVAATLNPNTRHTWRVRAELLGEPGPWSTTASFVTEDPAIINDPLTDGTTAGKQVGGRFIAGQGWQSTSLIDGIDYDIPTCSSCALEFDSTGVGRGEGAPFAKDLKWITMGDAGTFGSFDAFRDHPWKMHLEQRADGDGTGMKLIWRNGRAGSREPGDHTNRNDSTVRWSSSQVYHFKIDWNPSGLTVSIDGTVWFQDGFGGNAYAPPAHRISLGCYPRAESFIGAIFRNVKVVKR